MAVTYEYVGKTGGGGKIEPISGASGTPPVTITLPEGRWVLLVDWGSTGGLYSDLSLDGNVVAPAHSNSIKRSTAAVRGVEGGAHTLSTRYQSSHQIYSVSYFPDPE